MDNELICQLGLTLVPDIGDVQARILIKHFGSAAAIFRAKKKELEKLEGISVPARNSLIHFDDFSVAEKELKFIQKYKIKTLFQTDPSYPQRLLNCCDAPILLFYKGTADLNTSKVLSIVGTRKFTEYGKLFTENLINELSATGIMIISGLAYGIDSIAHRASLKNKMSTVGVVGHGLDMIYPPENGKLAKEMVSQDGGLLSEFFSGTVPDKHHFPLRNRIVAGLSDATIVVETPVKGGSMITAKLADSYNRDVFAVPGRAVDKSSGGCNYLIKHSKAFLLENTTDLLTILGWSEPQKKDTKKQRELFIELTPDESNILHLLETKDALHIDEINFKSGLSSSAIAAAILNLEMKNLIKSLPGKMYRQI